MVLEFDEQDSLKGIKLVFRSEYEISPFKIEGNYNLIDLIEILSVHRIPWQLSSGLFNSEAAWMIAGRSNLLFEKNDDNEYTLSEVNISRTQAQVILNSALEDQKKIRY